MKKEDAEEMFATLGELHNQIGPEVFWPMVIKQFREAGYSWPEIMHQLGLDRDDTGGMGR
jgi:hypothetical protein